MMQNKSRKMKEDKRMRKAMMTLDMLPPFKGLKNEYRLGSLLNGDGLFQHFSDPFQLLLNGHQKLMSVSIRSFLD
jgi:hypothetical protein